ncbi:MAG: hypothetical protein RDU14_04335 [Melioribacteraceae bacterium]|nr:hypothetical protein [Melioribacteraceae bacterium]
MHKYFFAFVLAVLFCLNSCDTGIEPGEPIVPGGFSGTISFSGTWPEGIKRTHLVVFKNPIQTTEDFFLPNLSFVVDSIQYKSPSYRYNSLVNSFISILKLWPGEYKYVVVAQSKTPEISFQRKDWTVVGVYCINNDQTKPASLLIRSDELTQNVNINVDFNNPPPQPPM